MCFSAEANFVAAGVIAAVGVTTLRHVDHPRAVLFASMPMLFALHQFTEAFVWLGLHGRIGQVALDHAAFLFLLYAQGILALLMPLAVLLMEPPGWRRLAVGGATLVGAVVRGWATYGVTGFPSRAFINHHSIAYRNSLTDSGWLAAGYVAATCGALLLSSHRVVRRFGVLNVAGLTVVMIVKGYAFSSVWCLYAAVLSIMIYWNFSRRHIDVDDPNSSFDPKVTSELVSCPLLSGPSTMTVWIKEGTKNGCQEAQARGDHREAA